MKIHHSINKEFLAKIGIEIFSVVFAVLLALSLNEWRKNASNRQLVNKAYSNIYIEINTNMEKLASVVPQYDSLIYILDSVITRMERNDTNFHFTFGNFNLELLSHTAWDAAKVTNSVNLMNFEEVIEISGVYDAQEIYSNLIAGFIEARQAEIMIKPEDNVLKLLYLTRSYLQQFSNIGKQLVESYEEVKVTLSDYK